MRRWQDLLSFFAELNKSVLKFLQARSHCWRIDFIASGSKWVSAEQSTVICEHIITVTNNELFDHVWLVRFYEQNQCLQRFDGASRGNPGRASAGAVLLDDRGREVISFLFIPLFMS